MSKNACLNSRACASTCQVYNINMQTLSFKQVLNLLSTNAGLSDLDITKRFYYGMIRTITRELRDKHTITLHDLGKFELIIHKGRRSRNVDTGVVEFLSAKPTMKFYPCRALKEYFYALGNESTVVK